jgi:hypothetical protein
VGRERQGHSWRLTLASPRASSARLRVLYSAVAVGTIAVGLAVNRGVLPLGGRARDLIGDALWAFMMTWWIAALAPGVSLRRRGVIALAICFAVEFSQLLHSPYLDALRRSVVGRLVLGSGFDARDLVAYAVGVVAALLIGRFPLRVY